MYNKKGGIPFGEIRGILVFMAVSLIFLLFFYGCIVKDEKEEAERTKVSSESLQLTRELYFIMESKLEDQDTIHEKLREIFINTFPSYNEVELKNDLDQFYNDYFPPDRVLTIIYPTNNIFTTLEDNDVILYDSYNRDPYYILQVRSSYGEYPISFTDKEGYHYTITIIIQKKMNKRGILGIQWDLLVLALLISSGILLFFNNDIELPDVGAYSEATTYAIEGNLGLIKDIRYFLNNTNEGTLKSFNNKEHIIFDIVSYCESEDYKDLAKNTQFEDDTGTLEVEYDDVNGPKNIERECYVLEEELANYYEELFVKKYNELKEEHLTEKNINLNIKFNEVRYESKIEEESEFYNIVEPKEPFTYPIFIEDERRNKEEIGNFKLNPSFKFLVDYDFNDENKEICIFSRDCGATCNEVMEKYPSGERDYNGYEIIDEGTISVDENTVTHLECERYHDCETPLDDFGKTFKCDRGVLCEGTCLPFCSIEADGTKIPDDSVIGAIDPDETKCTAYGCNSYMDCTAANSCECFSNPLFDNNCEGDNCVDFNCDRDPGSYDFSGTIADGTKTICKERACNSYVQHSGFSCSGAATCSCDTGKTACFGECCDAQNDVWDCSWSDCSTNTPSCGGGVREKTCNCRDSSKTCGGTCDPNNNPATVESCNVIAPVDGTWECTGSISDCNKGCGPEMYTVTCTCTGKVCGGAYCDSNSDTSGDYDCGNAMCPDEGII